ncbi:MAG: CHASE domain-containing protein, partial [Burkholderiaceae bacterium]|nr:CHASE domain-containing protein [Burkholderiaceae bacterium]
MKSAHATRRALAPRLIIVWLAVALGLALTAAAVRQHQRFNETHLLAVVNAETQRMGEVVLQLMRRLELGLIGTRGMALAVGWDELKREQFIRYARSRNIDKEFPGVRGLGLIRRVPVLQQAAFAASAAADGWPE